jgi:chromosome segregation ATPase
MMYREWQLCDRATIGPLIARPGDPNRRNVDNFSYNFVRGWRMNRSSLFALGILLFSMACFGQTTSGDSQTLQTILSEVRQLRQELQTTAIATQRAQILIYRLQGEEAAVARASQRLEEAREKVAVIRDQQEQVAANIKEYEDFIGNTDNPPTQRKQHEDLLPKFTARLESLKSEEQQRQTQEIEADQQLRAEQARLSELRDQLDRFDQALENASRRQGGNPQ